MTLFPEVEKQYNLCVGSDKIGPWIRERTAEVRVRASQVEHVGTGHGGNGDSSGQ
jgi:hypothetical protein